MSLFSKLTALENLGRSVMGTAGLNVGIQTGSTGISPIDSKGVTLEYPSAEIDGRKYDPSKIPTTLGGMITGLLRSCLGVVPARHSSLYVRPTLAGCFLMPSFPSPPNIRPPLRATRYSLGPISQTICIWNPYP